MTRSAWVPTSDREQLLTLRADPMTGVGLEIGALHNPIIPQGLHDIRFADFADTATLRAIHAGHPDWCARMVDVDYVWSGSGSLAEIVGDTNVFDYVIASHVIEHIPNMLGWFRGLAEVMKPGGVFNLAIPDKRFTFDICCPDSTVGQLIEADLLNYERPSIRQMFDHCYYAKAIEPGDIWVKRIDVQNTPAYSGETAPQLAMQQALEIHRNGRYFDSHCWIFSPTSFLKLVEGIIRLGLFPFIPDNFITTPLGKFEFYFSLKKPNDDERSNLLQIQIDALSRLKQACDDQRRWASLLAG